MGKQQTKKQMNLQMRVGHLWEKLGVVISEFENKPRKWASQIKQLMQVFCRKASLREDLKNL